MFKSASDKQSFQARVASHSTKESRTGLIRAIPEWAQEPEEYYNKLRDQYELANKQLRAMQDELTGINLKLKFSLPHREFEHLSQLKTALASRYAALQPSVSQLRGLVLTASEKAWATVFYHVAIEKLDVETRKALETETRYLIGREPREIKEGLAQKDTATHKSLTEKARRQAKRKRFHDRGSQNRYVWRDEDGGDMRGKSKGVT